jgi:hypothetical protein
MLARIAMTLGAVGAVAWAVAATLGFPAAVERCGTASLTWEPASPTQGALFKVRVSGALPGAQLSGSVAGEPLHFSADGVPESLAAVPIEGADSITIIVRCPADQAGDSLVARIGTANGNYPVEHLRVAPAFGRRPDSATAARIARESARAVDVARRAHRTPA